MIPVVKTVDNVDGFVMNVPICCQEGHDDCPHVIRQTKVRKRGNIGL